jgi:phosphoadenosine phosphosulfate reductase
MTTIATEWDAALARSASVALEGAPALSVIEWAVDRYRERICVTSSMADALVIDLASQVCPGLDVIFVDTGYHFAETYDTARRFAERYNINLITATPELTVDEQTARYGPNLFASDPDLCCDLRKVQPLSRVLAPYDAWITGVRRDETESRANARVVEWDSRRQKLKVNPIVSWTEADVDAYMAEHKVLRNALLESGYGSIGCSPCTLPGEGRSGRWAGTGKTECGIHGP